jgi:tetratricopeptide (TPR) repeat protein
VYSCPACGADAVEGQAACRCGADLSLLLRLNGMADAWFNRALEALARGAPGRALEYLAACSAARPTDAAALRALAKVWAQLGRRAEARDALERAAEIDPGAPELEALRRALRPRPRKLR